MKDTDSLLIEGGRVIDPASGVDQEMECCCATVAWRLWSTGQAPRAGEASVST